MNQTELKAKVTLTLTRWANVSGMSIKDLKADFEWLIDEWVKTLENPKPLGCKTADFEIEEWTVEMDEPRKEEE